MRCDAFRTFVDATQIPTVLTLQGPGRAARRPSAQPGHARHARHARGQPGGAGIRPADRGRRALRRPRHRQAGRVRAVRARRAHGRSTPARSASCATPTSACAATSPPRLTHADAALRRAPARPQRRGATRWRAMPAARAQHAARYDAPGDDRLRTGAAEAAVANWRRRRDRRLRRRPAPDVGGAALALRPSAQAPDQRRAGHDGLRPAGGDGRAVRLIRTRTRGLRQRRRLAS